MPKQPIQELTQEIYLLKDVIKALFSNIDYLRIDLQENAKQTKLLTEEIKLLKKL